MRFGGENGLHMHPNEDHTFIVLQGSARYYDADGGYTDVDKHAGIMLPAGTYYWFEATSKEPLVLVRSAAGRRPRPVRPAEHPRRADARRPRGEQRVPVVYREGEFFE